MKNAWVFLVFMLIEQQSVAQHFRISDVPTWALPVAAPDTSYMSRYDVMSGGYPSLVDYQFNLKEHVSYYHLAVNILTFGGVRNASEIEIAYDTAYQSVQFHYLYVWRDGERLDRTAQLKFESLRKETDLNKKIYTGKTTAFTILEDIRKDDRLEYAYSIHGSNPIFDNFSFLFLTLEQHNPVDRHHIRIVHDQDTGYRSECHNCEDVTIEEYDANGLHNIRLTRERISATDVESTAPPWHMPFAYFMISQFNSWDEVEKWAVNVFAHSRNPKTAALVKQMQAEHPTQELQITAAINYVQDRIRFMGVESGIGSIKPSAPDQVLKQRFGDCKDKSLLLVAMLKGLGIQEAYPVLVNSKMRHGIAQMLPSAQMFDHCIVHFRYKDKNHWIDPSSYRQGGSFETRQVVNFGPALLVGKGLGKLIEMNVVDTLSKTERNETFSMTSLQAPCTLKVETKLYGREADKLRASLENISSNELSDRLRGILGRGYPGISSNGPMTINDDRALNVLTTVETYLIPEPWKYISSPSYTGNVFNYIPVEMYRYMKMTGCEAKKHPVYAEHPVRFKQTSIFNVPSKEWFSAEELAFDNQAFRFHRILIDVSPTETKAVYRFESKTNEIPSNAYPEACQQMTELTNKLPVPIACPDTTIRD